MRTWRSPIGPNPGCGAPSARAPRAHAAWPPGTEGREVQADRGPRAKCRGRRGCSQASGGAELATAAASAEVAEVARAAAQSPRTRARAGCRTLHYLLHRSASCPERSGEIRGGQGQRRRGQRRRGGASARADAATEAVAAGEGAIVAVAGREASNREGSVREGAAARKAADQGMGWGEQ